MLVHIPTKMFEKQPGGCRGQSWHGRATTWRQWKERLRLVQEGCDQRLDSIRQYYIFSNTKEIAEDYFKMMFDKFKNKVLKDLAASHQLNYVHYSQEFKTKDKKKSKLLLDE